MAQEIQRQLEELEVKQKELEQQGVSVEKALRGEGNGWFHPLIFSLKISLLCLMFLF